MKMTKQELKAAKDRWKLAGQRTIDIYKHVGCLATHFAGLEIELQELNSKLLQKVIPPNCNTNLSKMSFKQQADLLNKLAHNVTDDQELLDEVQSICRGLKRAAAQRNDVIHSSWIAYTGDEYGQHKARKYDDKPTIIRHTISPTVQIDECTKTVNDLLSDLLVIECRLLEI